MGEEVVFSLERALQQHKDETAAEIQLVSNSIHVINQKTDVILEEIRKIRRGRVERALQQHKEETAAQIQLLKDSIHVVDQKTDLILEELQQCMNPIEVDGELIKQHKKETSAQIQLLSDSSLAVEQKTDLILEETRQIGIVREVSSSRVALLERGSPSSVLPLAGMFLLPSKDMAGLTPEGSQFNAQQYDLKMELANADGQDFFTSYDEVHESFDAMGLSENLLRSIYAYGFEKPSCRILPAYWRRLPEPRTRKVCSRDQVECQALVHAPAPTRELAQQIEKIMGALGGDYVGAKVHACLGAGNGNVTFRKVSDLIPLAKSRTSYYLQKLDKDLLKDLRPVLVTKVCQKKLATPKGPTKPKKSEFRQEISRRSKKSRISSSSHFKMYR